MIATASSRDLEYARALGASTVVDYRQARFEDVAPAVDVVIDTAGGEARERSFKVLKPGGILVSVVSSPFLKYAATKHRAKAVFFFVDVTTERLDTISEFFDSGKLAQQVGTLLPLEEARTARQMLAGAPHARGKIVLSVAP